MNTTADTHHPLCPHVVRDVLDRWLAAASPEAAAGLWAGETTLTLADGTTVGWTPEPGVLLVDGVRRYSAAWL